MTTHDHPFSFLNQFTGNVTPTRKPQYDVPPAWKKQHILGLEEQGDIRRYTQIKAWIKPPTQAYPNTNCFMSLVNAKGSVFVRLKDIDELKLMISTLASWIPEMQQTIDNLKPQEIQMQMAIKAFDEALRTELEQEEK